MDEILQDYLVRYETLQAGHPTLTALASSAVLLLALVLLLAVLRGMVRRSARALGVSRWATQGVMVREWQLFAPEAVRKYFERALWFAYAVAKWLLAAAWLLGVLALFPQTLAAAQRIGGFLSEKLQAAGPNFVEYIPSLIFILIVAFVTVQAVKLLKIFMDQIEAKKIAFPMFPAEYAAPTRQILSFFLILFAMVLVAPYLPGAGTQAFQAVTLFVGVLVSLGSSTAVANLIASFVLQYMRAFRTGDTVEIGGHVGTVTAVQMFSTRIRTLGNEEIAIPNTVVLTSAMKNYSRCEHVALRGSVSIGYDVPWPRVHEALLQAAGRMDEVLGEPKPFVIQRSLDDFYVSYELLAYTKEVTRLPVLTGKLNEKIRETFDAAGIEILSPAQLQLRGPAALPAPAPG